MTPTEDLGDDEETELARYHAGLARLALLTGAYVAAMMIGAYVAARAGAPRNLPGMVTTGVVTISTARAAVQSWRTASVERVRELEVEHMLVWVATILATIFGTVVWVLAGRGLPSSGYLLWAFTIVAVLGVVATRVRARHLLAEE